MKGKGMRRKRRVLAGIFAAGVALAGCTQSENNEPLTTAGAEEKVPTHGPATGIINTNANQADVGIGGPVQNEAGGFETETVAEPMTDEELENRIRVALTTGSLGTTGAIAEDQLTDIQVEAENGVVTLTGPVQSEDEKKVIGERVSGITGVERLINLLEITPAADRAIPLNPLTPRTPVE